MTLFDIFIKFFSGIANFFENPFEGKSPKVPHTLKEQFFDYSSDLFIGIKSFSVLSLSFLVTILVLILVHFLAKQIASYFVNPILAHLVNLKQTKKEDLGPVLKKIDTFLAVGIVYLVLPLLIPSENSKMVIFYRIFESVLLWQVISIFVFMIISIHKVNSLRQMNEIVPVESLSQAAGYVLYGVGGILVFLHLANINLLGFLAGIGALSAILLLIFQDTLLNITATFKIFTNRLIKVGDWIAIPSLNLEGTVSDIYFGTVKIQNADMSISCFPPKSLVATSFKNWSNMFKSSARQSLQSIIIDLFSIKPLSEEEIAKIKSHSQLQVFWKKHADSLISPQSKPITNMSLFKSYLLFYLKNHQMIRQDLMIFVRNLSVTDKGLPIQIQFYSKEASDFQVFENLQAETIEHAFSIIHLFFLNPYQSWSGKSVDQSVH